MPSVCEEGLMAPEFCRLDTSGFSLELHIQNARRGCLGASYPTLLCLGFCCLVVLFVVVLVILVCHWHAQEWAFGRQIEPLIDGVMARMT